jgi:hypothetical protein
MLIASPPRLGMSTPFTCLAKAAPAWASPHARCSSGVQDAPELPERGVGQPDAAAQPADQQRVARPLLLASPMISCPCPRPGSVRGQPRVDEAGRRKRCARGAEGIHCFADENGVRVNTPSTGSSTMAVYSEGTGPRARMSLHRVDPWPARYIL